MQLQAGGKSDEPEVEMTPWWSDAVCLGVKWQTWSDTESNLEPFITQMVTTGLEAAHASASASLVTADLGDNSLM